MNYEGGLEALRKLLPEQAQAELELLSFRLLQNLDQERHYGSTETTRAERNQVVEGLNELGRRHGTPDFASLCRERERRAVPRRSLSQLRPPVADFVGRQQEIEALVGQLSRAGEAGVAVAIRGMGGIGKTELAYAAAQQVAALFPDAQLLVELRGSDHPMTPVQALQSALQTLEPGAKLPVEQGQLQLRYRASLQGRRVLILADDAQDAGQVRCLLPPPGSALIVTTRQRFTLPELEILELYKLDEASAQALLLAICPRIGVHAARLAQRCGNHALALRVSASQLAHDDFLPVERYLQKLANERTRVARLKEPNDPHLDVEASLELSYNAIGALARLVLCQMSIFAGSYDHAALEGVVRPPKHARHSDLDGLLSELRHHSLLEWDRALERYSLHELVRSFAAARLKNDENIRLRYARHYLELARHADQLYKEGGEHILAGLELFDRERAHISAVWRWLLSQEQSMTADMLLLDYGAATVTIGFVRYNLRQELLPQLEVVLQAARRLKRKSAEGAALDNLGTAYTILGDYVRASAYLEDALAIAGELGDRHAEAQVLTDLGLAYTRQGAHERAIACYERAIEHARALADRHAEAQALGQLAQDYALRGEHDQALAAAHQANELARALGDRLVEAETLKTLGMLYTAAEIWPQGMACFELGLGIALELGQRAGEAEICWLMGEALARQGELARAVELMQRRVDYRREVGHLLAEQDAARVEELRQDEVPGS